MTNQELVEKVLRQEEAAAALLLATATAIRDLLADTAGEWDDRKRKVISDLGEKIDAFEAASKVE